MVTQNPWLRDQTFNTDFNSSATGAAHPGDVTPLDRSMQTPAPTDRGGGQGGGFGGGSTQGGVGAPASGVATIGNDWWDKTQGNLYGPEHLLADSGAWWRGFAKNQLGINSADSDTAAWLASIVPNPTALARATGMLTGVSSNDQELKAQSALGQLLGQNADFSPSAIIKTTLSAIANYDPQKGAAGPGGALGLQLYDHDPAKMVGNIVNFLQSVLQGIMPQDTLQMLQNALVTAANMITDKAINTPGTTLPSDKPGQGVANQLMSVLQRFGVV